MHNEALSAAMLIWIGRKDETFVERLLIRAGWWRDSWPNGNDERLLRKIGRAKAHELLPQLHELKDDFYRSKAWKVASELEDMAKMAATEFQPRHPELSEEAVRALAVCYVWHHK